MKISRKGACPTERSCRHSRGTSALGLRPPNATKGDARRRAVTQRRGFGQRLQSAKEISLVTQHMGQEYAYAAPTIRPSLTVYCAPEGCSGARGPLGLSSPVNSQNRSRPGLSGISSNGTKFIKDSLTLMEDFKERLAMWTVTLPDEDYSVFSTGRASWPLFQRYLIDLLTRYLQGAQDPAVVVAAVELGDERTKRTRRPMPHIHIVTTGWGSRDGGKWLLRPEVMDELVAKAAQYAGLPSRDRFAVSRIEPIRHSVRAYMSKYLTKQAKPEELDLDSGWDELIPRQWWNRSDAAFSLVKGLTWKLSPAFAAFLVQRRKELEALGLGLGFLVTVGRRKTKTMDRAIELTGFHFFQPESLARAIELFVLWIASEEAFVGEVELCLSQGAPARHSEDIVLLPQSHQPSTLGSA